MSINKNPEEILLYNSLKGLHLLEKTDKQTILEDLLGIQCQFSSYAQNSLRIRANDYSDNNWKDDTVKIWSHRGTLHIVNNKDLPLHLAASGYEKDFVDGAWGISKENAERWAPFIVDEIRKGNTSREGLKDACTAKGMSESLKERIFYG